MQITIVPLISGGGACVGLFVAAFLLFRPGENRTANFVLSGLMFLLSLSIIYPLLVYVWPGFSRMHAVAILEPFQFAIAPLTSLYFRVLLVPGYRLRPSHLLHALPFILIGLLGLVPIPPGREPHGFTPLLDPTKVLWALLVIQAFLYLVPSIRLLFRYRHSLRDQESNLSGLDLRWLMWFAHLLLALTTIYAILLPIMMHGPRTFPVRGYLSVALSALVFIIGQRALLQRQPPEIEGLQPARRAGAPEAQRAVVAPEEAEEIRARLVRAMETERLFLDPDLNLSDLVQRIGATRNQVSWVINRLLGKNFYDFVNEYRVRDVVRLMNEKAYDDMKITTLAFDAGFNSKPAFNSVFKKHTGLTPSEYRDRRRKPSRSSP